MNYIARYRSSFMSEISFVLSYICLWPKYFRTTNTWLYRFPPTRCRWFSVNLRKSSANLPSKFEESSKLGKFQSSTKNEINREQYRFKWRNAGRELSLWHLTGIISFRGNDRPVFKPRFALGSPAFVPDSRDRAMKISSPEEDRVAEFPDRLASI